MDMRRWFHSFSLFGLAVFVLWTGRIDIYAKQEETFDEQEAELKPMFPDNFRDVLFIGDSRTVGLLECGQLGEADVFAKSGMTVFKLWDSELYFGGDKKTLRQALTENQYQVIHLMLGVIELGYPTERIVEKYRETVKEVQSMQRQAKIVLGANLHVTLEKSENSDIFNNRQINELNGKIEQIGQDLDCCYIDVNEEFDDAQGNLLKTYSADGLHMLGEYYGDWARWLQERDSVSTPDIEVFE